MWSLLFHDFWFDFWKQRNATELFLFFDVKRIVFHVSYTYSFCTFISRRFFPVFFYSIIKAKGLCSQKWIIFWKWHIDTEQITKHSYDMRLTLICRRDLFHVAVHKHQQHQYHYYWHWYSMICMELNLEIWFTFLNIMGS